jgi:hypothetical protein
LHSPILDRPIELNYQLSSAVTLDGTFYFALLLRKQSGNDDGFVQAGRGKKPRFLSSFWRGFCSSLAQMIIVHHQRDLRADATQIEN